MAEFLDLRQEVLYQAPGVLDEVILNTVRMTVIDLCKRAQIWQHDIAQAVPDTTETERQRVYFSRWSGDSDVAFTVPAEVEDLLYVWVTEATHRERAHPETQKGLYVVQSQYRDEMQRYAYISATVRPSDSYLTPDPDSLTADQLTELGLTADDSDEAKAAAVWSVRGEMPAVDLYPIPKGGTILESRLSLRPSFSDTEIANGNLFQEYREPILWGALYRILQMPYKEWTNGRAATMYQGQYEEALNRARVRASGRNVGAAPQTTYGGIPFTAQRGYRAGRYTDERGRRW